MAAQIEGLPMPQQLDTRSLQQPAAQRGWMGPAGIGIEQATFGQGHAGQCFGGVAFERMNQ